MASVINRGTKTEPAWYAKFKDADGKHKRVHTHQTTKEGAKRFAAELEARVARGLVGIPEAPKPEEQAARALTVSELADKFLEGYNRPKIRNIHRYRARARSLIKNQINAYPIGAMVAAQVRRRDVERWRDTQHEAGYSPNTVNHALHLLAVMYGWAEDQEMLTCANPCRRVENLRAAPSEEHYSLKEVHALLSLPAEPPAFWFTLSVDQRQHRSYSDEQLRVMWRSMCMMICTALYTGMRKGELFGLRWGCVKLEGELPRIEVKKSYNGPTKSGKSRILPIHPELLPELRRWHQECPTPDDMVFPVARVRSVAKLGAWRMGRGYEMLGLVETLQGAGVHVPQHARKNDPRSEHETAAQDRAWHAFRHSFATHFMEASGNGDAQSKMLGHSQGSSGQAAVSGGYTHTSLAYLARELAKMTLKPPAAPGITSLQERQRQRAAAE